MASYISKYGWKIKDILGRIPDNDFSIIGYDDSELATLTDLQLTSVIHPKYKLGVWAAEMLLEQLNNPKKNLTS